MSPTRRFWFVRLRATGGGGWQALHDRLLPCWSAWTDARLMGSFLGLFGLSNQELFLMLSLPSQEDGQAGLRGRLPPDVELVQALALDATARPADDTPLTRAGVYVFRFFDVADADVQEVVDLSVTAWETFERDDAYAAEPMGLFRFAERSAGRGPMLLLTWYRDLASWERSRAPHPDATANFRRRAALTRSALPYATRLIGPPA